MKTQATAPCWIRIVLWLAAVYNLAWGAYVVLRPNDLFERAGMPLPNYPELWQCLGMVVGVYGLGYAIAARDPVRHAPLVLVGFIGKILGPIGFLHAAIEGGLPWVAGWMIVCNDLVWWLPFTLLLMWVYRRPVGIAE